MNDDRRFGIGGFVRDRGMRLVARAVERVMADARGQEAVAAAVGAAQRGRRRFEAMEERILHAVGLAARPDYADLAKRLARVKRKARELSDKLAGAPPDESSR